MFTIRFIPLYKILILRSLIFELNLDLYIILLKTDFNNMYWPEFLTEIYKDYLNMKSFLKLYDRNHSNLINTIINSIKMTNQNHKNISMCEIHKLRAKTKWIYFIKKVI